ncbi:MAG TPA: sad1-interacting factor 2, partial [Zetaproteobacteria bacterium]|nr:sad1-interacting factor 2 [Zetaproteobacteria bacterium]
MQTRCDTYVLAKHFNFDALQEHFATAYRTCVYRNALHVKDAAGDVFLFDYGVVVLWGTGHDSEKRILDQLSVFLEEPLEEPIGDYFTFDLAADGATRIRSDHITLNSSDIMVKLAVSHGLAQSCKLSELEA